MRRTLSGSLQNRMRTTRVRYITKEHEEKACKIFTKQKRRTLIESAQNNMRSSHLHLHSTVLREYSFTEILNYSEIRICEMKI